MTNQIDSLEMLQQVHQKMQAAERLEEIIWDLERDILTLLQAERMTIYQKANNGAEIVSWYRSGSEEGIDEIRLPLSPTSIAGYVAMSRQPILIADVYDADSLQQIHPDLRFDYSYDQNTGFLTTSMIVIPIKFNETLLGVLQIINRVSGGAFSDEDLQNAQEIAAVIGEKFRYELKSSIGPYDFLLKAGKLTLDELEELEQKAAESDVPVTLLMTTDLGIPSEEIGHSLEAYYQVPFFPYNEELEIANEFLENLNTEYLASNMWVPLVGNHEKAIILIDNPNDSERIMEIQNVISSARYEFLVGLQEDILRFLGFEITAGPQEIVEPELGLDDLVNQLQLENIDADDDSDLDEEESTIVQLVNRIIFDAVGMNASDIHMEPSKGRRPAAIRMRVDGECRVVLEIPYTHIRPVVARVKVMSNLDIAERRRPQSGKMTCRLGNRPLELRVETVPTVNGESAVMRILSAGDALPFDKLNLLPSNEKIVMEALTHPHGLFLVVGPTGSGKTTTLHAILGHINTPDKKILTAEDPVEITQPGLQQVQVQPKIGLDFATVLRSFLRADPDIILIGEMRDHETAHAGIEASLTGHLVFSTLHTNSAPETIVRLLDMGLDPMNFADAFIGVVAQRLVRTLCKECKEAYLADQEERQRILHLYGEEFIHELGIEDLEHMELSRPVGCEVCNGSGYKGRTGIHEVILTTPDLKKLIMTKADVGDIRKLAIKNGMRTLVQDGVAKVLKGQTDLAQLSKVTVS